MPSVDRYASRLSSKIFRFKGMFLVGGITSLEKAIHLVTFIALSPWISPADYGLFALAWVVMAVVDGFFDFGASLGFFSDKSDFESAKRVMNGAALMFSAFWAILCVFIAVLVSLFEGRSIDEILYVLAGVVFLRGFVYPSAVTFARNQNYRLLAISGITPAIVGGVTGIGLAIFDWGVWALVCRYVVDAVVRCFIVWIFSPYTHALSFDTSRVVRWVREGWRLAVSNNLGWLVVMQSEQLIIGSVMGPAILGIYNFAKKPVDIAGQALGQMGSKYFLPTYVRQQYSVYSVIKMSIMLSVLVALVSLPLCWTAMTSVISYWPPQWAPSVSLMPFVFMLLPVLMLEAPLKSYLAAQGHSAVVLKLTVLSAVASMLTAIICAFTSKSIEFIAGGAVVIGLFRAVAFVLSVVRVEKPVEASVYHAGSG